MKFLLAAVAASLLLLTGPVRAEDDAAVAAEREQMKDQAQRLLDQGAADYERLRQARTAVEDEKAALGAAGSLSQRDQLARRAQAIDVQVRELRKARSRLEDAKNRVLTGRLDAARVAFNNAVKLWSQVHEKIVAHLGEAPAPDLPAAVPAPTGTGDEEVTALRKEVRALRAELEALRAEVRALRAMVEQGAR